MSNAAIIAPRPPIDNRLERLVKLVEQDVRLRGLRSGERYLNTQEVASQLGVSTRLANDAMRVLAERGILARKPKAGTVVGPAVEPPESEMIRHFEVIHLLIRNDYLLAERDRIDSIVTGLLETLPGCDIQFSFVPAYNELAHTERLVKSAGASKRAYIIAVKSPQLQRFFAEASLPAVLLGTPFQGIENLSWIDKDQEAIGRILIRRLIASGHKSIGVVLRDRRGFGDDLMMNAITHEVLSAQLKSDALHVRSVPMDRTLTHLAIHQILSGVNRPSAIICRSRLILAAAEEACHELRLQIGRDVTLALCDPQSTRNDKVSTPCLRPIAELALCGEGRLIGQFLLENGPIPRHHVIQVSFADSKVSKMQKDIGNYS